MVKIPVVFTDGDKPVAPKPSEQKSEKIYPNSETSKCRLRLGKYCVGDGLDLGYGGDPIVRSAITVDLPYGPYGCVFGDHPQNLHGDATKLHWFNNEVLDYVYASHLIEDFSPQRIKEILIEWFRVIKPGGYLVIYCPVERVYRAYCLGKGTKPNASHRNENFDLKFLLDLVDGSLKKGSYEVAHSLELDDSYCFDLVLKKGSENVV
jgi:SAM-dependent methyltransferase